MSPAPVFSNITFVIQKLSRESLKVWEASNNVKFIAISFYCSSHGCFLPLVVNFILHGTNGRGTIGRGL